MPLLVKVKDKSIIIVTKENQSQAIFAHITIGLQLAITILLFVFGGHKLDSYYHKSPLFVTLGAVVGMVLGFYQLIRELRRIDDRQEKISKKVKEKKRWM